MMKKLSKKNIDDLWGDEGPYSEVSLIEQTRILDDFVSRVFLVVEAKINPFTFEYVLKHRSAFKDDIKIQQLLDHAEYRGPDYGYVVSAGEEELIDKESYDTIAVYKKIAMDSIITMHSFVMNELGIKGKEKIKVKIKDLDDFDDDKYVWDDLLQKAIKIDDGIWGEDSFVGSPAGAKNGKLRYFVVLVLSGNKIAIDKKDLIYSAGVLKKLEKKLNVEIESVDAGMGYMMLTVLIDLDTIPLEFIETFIKESNKNKKIFRLEHFVTNVRRPKNMEIIGFMKGLK